MTIENPDNTGTSSSVNHEPAGVAVSSQHISDEEYDGSVFQHLLARLETGLIGPDKLDDDVFLKSVWRHDEYMSVKKYTRDTSISQPAHWDMVTESTAEDQLKKLTEIKKEKKGEECLWVDLSGIEEKVISGITELCGLPKSTIMDHLILSQNRHHRSHLEIHPLYKYIQLLVQYSPESMNNTAIYDMVKNVFKPGIPIDGEGDMKVDVDKLIRRGFLSIFMFPSLNILITIRHSHAEDTECPASRLVLASVYVDEGAFRPGVVYIHANAELLGLSIVHRAIGYASNVVRNVEKTMRDWEDHLKVDFWSINIEEVHRLMVHLQDFKKRLKPLDRLHGKLLKHYHQSCKSAEHRTPSIRGKVVMMLDQGKEALKRILEDTEELSEKGKNLENHCFNMSSKRANDSMERLAIVTIVFLPLTFIASYFSMGFVQFGDLSKSPIYFWEISIPCSFAFFLIFAYSSSKRGLIRLSLFTSRLKRWMQKQTKWWGLDFELWWRRKMVSWSKKDGERGNQQAGKAQP